MIFLKSKQQKNKVKKIRLSVKCKESLWFKNIKAKNKLVCVVYEKQEKTINNNL